MNAEKPLTLREIVDQHRTNPDHSEGPHTMNVRRPPKDDKRFYTTILMQADECIEHTLEGTQSEEAREEAISQYIAALQNPSSGNIAVLLNGKNSKIDPTQLEPSELAHYHHALIATRLHDNGESLKKIKRNVQEINHYLNGTKHLRTFLNYAEGVFNAITEPTEIVRDAVVGLLAVAGVAAIATVFIGYHYRADILKAIDTHQQKAETRMTDTADVRIVDNQMLRVTNYKGKEYVSVMLEEGMTLNGVKRMFPSLGLQVDKDFYWHTPKGLEPIPNAEMTHRNLEIGQIVYFRPIKAAPAK